MEDLLRATAERAARYLAGLQDRAVAPTPEALANLRRLDEPLPERPTDPSTVIRLLDEIGSPATMASAGGRFFGFVVGGSLPATVAASSLAAARRCHRRGRSDFVEQSNHRRRVGRTLRERFIDRKSVV